MRDNSEKLEKGGEIFKARNKSNFKFDIGFFSVMFIIFRRFVNPAKDETRFVIPSVRYPDTHIP